MENHIEGCSFDVATQCGTVLTVEIYPSILSRTVRVFTLPELNKKELRGRERDDYLQHSNLSRFVDMSVVGQSVRVREEGMKLQQTVHLQGYLTKREGQYILSGKEGMKLTISNQSIADECVRDSAQTTCHNSSLVISTYVWKGLHSTGCGIACCSLLSSPLEACEGESACCIAKCSLLRDCLFF